MAIEASAPKSKARAQTGLLRWLSYRSVSAILHQPRLLRSLGALIRHEPLLESNAPVVARASVARSVQLRPASFSHIVYEPNLVAGDFVIGMEAGPRHDQDRAFIWRVIGEPEYAGMAALAECKARVGAWSGARPLRFDLIDDYMVWVAWAGMRGFFGTAAKAIESTPPAGAGPSSMAATMHAFFREMRYPGAHLLIGAVATDAVQRRAERSAQALRERIRVNLPALRAAWGTATDSHPPDSDLLRNGVGLLWVGHPATAQAGALVMQEWLRRPRIYDHLLHATQALADRAWSDGSLRAEVRGHVIETLRFRPPFPLVLRQAPRKAEYEVPGERSCPVSAGARLFVLTLAAMFDPDAIDAPKDYRPNRPTAADHEARHHMIFGYGPCACVAQDHVVEILTSALLGLLMLPRLTWADGWLSRIRYDGPTISRMRLRAA